MMDYDLEDLDLYGIISITQTQSDIEKEVILFLINFV